MISRQKRFLFIHVPKTGGNSIQFVLKEYADDEIITQDKDGQDGTDRFGLWNRQYGTTKHTTLNQYYSAIDADLYQTLFKFAVIRNPWDRMISLYFSPHRRKKQWNRKQFLALVKRARPFRYYVIETMPARSGVVKDLGKTTIRGRSLDKDIDFIMKFENLDQGFRIVCRTLGIPEAPLPQSNRSIRAHYSQYYDDELIKIVGEKFSEEIQYGNYRFEYA